MRKEDDIIKKLNKDAPGARRIKPNHEVDLLIAKERVAGRRRIAPISSEEQHVQPLREESRERDAAQRRPITPSEEVLPKPQPKVKRESYKAEEKEKKFRHELKYYLNTADYLTLSRRLSALLPSDEHAGETGDYLIRSLYFDDMYDSALNEKLDGIENRYKYRVRIYNYSGDIIRFEKKIKEGKFISKESFKLTKREFENMMRGNVGFLLAKESNLAREVYLKIRQDGLKPAVVVDYTREAYVLPYENIRITFDKDLKSGRPTGNIFDKDLFTMPMLELGTVILEVKFDKALPDYIGDMINYTRAMQQSAISKYVLCRKYD